MSCLHTISKSPGTQLLESCLKIIASGDAILFIEDGTYYANSARKLEAIDKACKIYGLSGRYASAGNPHKGCRLCRTYRYRPLCEALL